MRGVGASIAYALIAAVVLLGMYALTPSNVRATMIGSYAPAVIAGIPGVLAWLRSRDAAQIGAQNAQRLNGDLDRRIQQNTKDAITEWQASRARSERANDS